MRLFVFSADCRRRTFSSFVLSQLDNYRRSTTNHCLIMNFLKRLFQNEPPKQGLHAPLTQTEREAIIDLLLLAIYADNHISHAETVELDNTVDSIGWDSGSDVELYINGATARARSARQNQETKSEFIDYVAERLSTTANKQRALDLLNRLFIADGKSDEEAVLFALIESKLS